MVPRIAAVHSPQKWCRRSCDEHKHTASVFASGGVPWSPLRLCLRSRPQLAASASRGLTPVSWGSSLEADEGEAASRNRLGGRDGSLHAVPLSVPQAPGPSERSVFRNHEDRPAGRSHQWLPAGPRWPQRCVRRIAASRTERRSYQESRIFVSYPSRWQVIPLAGRQFCRSLARRSSPPGTAPHLQPRYDDGAAARDSGPYRFTLKLKALLLPAVVVTVTFTAPYVAFAGTLHLICVSLQETYLVHVVLPNFTALVPCDAPKSVPLMVTRAPRLAEAGLSLVMLGSAVTLKLVRLVAMPPGGGDGDRAVGGAGLPCGRDHAQRVGEGGRGNACGLPARLGVRPTSPSAWPVRPRWPCCRRDPHP